MSWFDNLMKSFTSRCLTLAGVQAQFSYDVCMQLYKKEHLTENSFLSIYGLQGAGFNAQQLAVVSGLYEWRDIVARTEDESTGYVLPNKTLQEIAKQMPVTKERLQKLTKSKHPHFELNYDSIISIIIHSLENAPAFEATAQQLKEIRVTTPLGDIPDKYRTEAPLPKMPNSNIANSRKGSIGVESAKSPFPFALKMDTLQHQNKPGQLKFGSNSPTSEFSHGSLNTSQQNRGKEEVKLEQIRFSANLPLHSFLGGIETPSIAHKTSLAQKYSNDPGSMTSNNQESTNQLRERSSASKFQLKRKKMKLRKMLPTEQ